MKNMTSRSTRVAAAVAIAGGLSVAGMSTASAAVEGNLETSNPMYYCEGGAQKFVVYTRTLNSTDTVSYTVGGQSKELGEFEPKKRFGYVYAIRDLGGTKVSITFSTKKSGDSITVPVSVPTSCNGLPTERPKTDWEGQAVGPEGSADPSETATSSAPADTDAPSGPPVETGVVSDGTNGSTLALVGLLSMGVVAAGAAATTRLNKR
ncbi:hypothetical protein [Demetria terragena]|uniref:hypothetical protein n=1 Tax=Demetria terragena TaxID=63959 RepID=UPI00037B9E46|nr:hypothetical protein [Demetria terragena]